MTDAIIEAGPEQVLAVVEQMTGLPWPDGDDWLAWEIDGLEGQTSYLMHVLPLAATTDAAALTSYTAAITSLADRRWVTRFRFDATRFTDDAATDPGSYDRRSAPASLVRSLGAEDAVWWRRGDDAVMLVVGTAAAPDTRKAAVLVLSTQWLTGPGAEEPALREPSVVDLLSGERDRILPVVWAVIRTRDPEVLAPLARALPAIVRATGDIALGGALASNRAHLDHALARVERFAAGDCLCGAYPAHLFYDPVKEADRQHVTILDTVPNDRQWVPDRICACRDCGARFQVEQGEYHYTWWQWTALAAVVDD